MKLHLLLLLSSCPLLASGRRSARAPHVPRAPLAAAAGANACANATRAQCGASPSFCAQACAWNASAAQCQQADNYPMPSNASLAALVGPASPLTDYTTINFYGDSITWLGVYEAVLSDALAASPFVGNLSVRVIDQGVNGGTVKDLVRGWSPWGHLNPSLPQSNISFAQTLDQDGPDVVVVQIGINDVWQAGPSCGARCSNVTEFVRVLREDIAAEVFRRNMSLVLASVSTIGEAPDGGNALDAQLDAFAAAQRALAAELGVPFVDLRAADEAYERANNCLALPSGLLTYDGVHPLVPRGARNLANLHAGGLLAALRNASGRPRPAPKPHGGRLFLTASSYDLDLGGIAGADRLCSAEAGEPAKALLADEAGCAGAPCRRASLSPFRGDGQVDWPLRAGRSYTRFGDNATQVGFTDEAGLLAFPLYKPIVAGCHNQASGIDTDWTTRTNETCGSWTQVSSGAEEEQQSNRRRQKCLHASPPLPTAATTAGASPNPRNAGLGRSRARRMRTA